MKFFYSSLNIAVDMLTSRRITYVAMS